MHINRHLRRMAAAPGKTLVMGIVNVTPDSFSDGGNYFDASAAVKHAVQLVAQGADIIDVGAESTRPSATRLTCDQEISRLEPVLAELRDAVDVPISIDTYHAQTAEFAIENGADIINDIWGGLEDEGILRVAAEAHCDYIYMHNRRTPTQGDSVGVLLAETQSAIARCQAAGIQPESLWLDPGIGFGKTYEQNLLILQHLNEYCALGYPVLLGTSRKSVIGKTLGTVPNDRLEGSLATVSVGVMKGVAAVRVHDVEATVRTCRMIEAINNVR